ncbi:hypothetical protein GGS20DRAFT_585066 [Poronia punctata]|nr:hypothetical protein GGS20DRAFT_585066 [Poronia punctata]
MDEDGHHDYGYGSHNQEKEKENEDIDNERTDGDILGLGSLSNNDDATPDKSSKPFDTVVTMLTRFFTIVLQLIPAFLALMAFTVMPALVIVLVLVTLAFPSSVSLFL